MLPGWYSSALYKLLHNLEGCSVRKYNREYLILGKDEGEAVKQERGKKKKKRKEMKQIGELWQRSEGEEFDGSD